MASQGNGGASKRASYAAFPKKSFFDIPESSTPPPAQAKVEQPKVEQPKVEQPKVEQPKVEQPKVEQPKVEQPKVEQPKVEQPKVEQPVAEPVAAKSDESRAEADAASPADSASDASESFVAAVSDRAQSWPPEAPSGSDGGPRMQAAAEPSAAKVVDTKPAPSESQSGDTIRGLPGVPKEQLAAEAAAPADKKTPASEATEPADKKVEGSDGGAAADSPKQAAPAPVEPGKSEAEKPEKKKTDEAKTDEAKTDEAKADAPKAGAHAEAFPEPSKKADKSAEAKKKRKKLVDSGEHGAIHEEFFMRGDEFSNQNLAAHAEGATKQAPVLLEEAVVVAPPTPEQLERRRKLRRVVLMVVAGALFLAAIAVLKIAQQKNQVTDTYASAEPSRSPTPSTPVSAAAVTPSAPTALPSATASAAPETSAEPVASVAASASAEPSASAVASAAPSASAVASSTAPTIPDGVNPKKEAERLLNMGKYKDAIPMAEAAIERDPEDATPYLFLGSALQSIGRWKEGVAAYSKCVHTAKKGPVAECRAVGGH